MTTAELESTVLAMKSEIAELKARLDRAEWEAIERRGDEEVAQGKSVPARQALERLRQKHNIPAR